MSEASPDAPSSDAAPDQSAPDATSDGPAQQHAASSVTPRSSRRAPGEGSHGGAGGGGWTSAAPARRLEIPAVLNARTTLCMQS